MFFCLGPKNDPLDHGRVRNFRNWALRARGGYGVHGVCGQNWSVAVGPLKMVHFHNRDMIFTGHEGHLSDATVCFRASSVPIRHVGKHGSKKKAKKVRFGHVRTWVGNGPYEVRTPPRGWGIGLLQQCAFWNTKKTFFFVGSLGSGRGSLPSYVAPQYLIYVRT